MLFIYTFQNLKYNYCDGEFYFIAEDKPAAITMARDFQYDHNKQMRYVHAYMIEFDMLNIKEAPVKPGYIALGRK